MPPFGSGASNSILCLPVILPSHPSNEASRPLVDVGRGCASRRSGVRLAKLAAAAAASVPKKPRRGVAVFVNSNIDFLLVMRPRWICDIGWCIAFRPIVFFPSEIGSRVGVNVGRDVECRTIGERPGSVEWHVAADELGGSTNARHPGADVVGLGAPHRRRTGRSLAARSMTLGARRGEY